MVFSSGNATKGRSEEHRDSERNGRRHAHRSRCCHALHAASKQVSDNSYTLRIEILLQKPEDADARNRTSPIVEASLGAENLSHGHAQTRIPDAAPSRSECDPESRPGVHAVRDRVERGLSLRAAAPATHRGTIPESADCTGLPLDGRGGLSVLSPDVATEGTRA